MKFASICRFKRVITAVTVSICLVLVITKTWLADGSQAAYKYGTNHKITNNNGETLRHNKAAMNYPKGNIIVPNYPHLSEQDLLDDVQNLTKKMGKCFKATNMRLFDGLTQQAALKSASNYVREFRKVIPMNFELNFTYPSHCWKMSYKAHTNDARHIWGHIGKVTFDEVLPNDYRSSLLRDIQKNFQNHFTSQTVCLPTLFLTGFPKCGSTYLWCLITHIINATVKVRVASFKEPGWWYERNDSTLKKIDASELGRYIANFATPLKSIDKSGDMNVVLADGTPGIAYASPSFNQKEHHRLNYCLLPTAIPHFLPHAKFIMIMREPSKALYSSFWWGCKGQLNDKSIKLVPRAFHEGVTSKIDAFNNCMMNRKKPEIQQVCSISASNYSSCITHPKRLLLLDKCTYKMTTTDFTAHGMPKCAKLGFNMYMYFVHVRRWLSVTPREKFYFLTINDTSDPVAVAEKVLHLLDIPLPSDLDQMAKQAYSQCQKRKNTQKVSYSKTSSLQMREETKMYLDKFFAPFNKMLTEMLNDPKFLFS